MAATGRIHDRALLDALENMVPVAFDAPVWRVTIRGRDPLRGTAANGRWSTGTDAEVLYASLEREGALAEIGFRLALEPVWPSRLQHEVHQLAAKTGNTLRFPDIAGLGPFGIDGSKYQGFDFDATRALAAAAHFLEFDAIIVPSARHPALNLVLFMDRNATAIEITRTEAVDWNVWRRGQGKAATTE